MEQLPLRENTQRAGRPSRYLDLGKLLVYWGKDYTPVALAAVRLQRLLSQTIDAFLVILAAAGAVSGALHLSLTWRLESGWWQGPLLAPFWIGVLAACLLFARRGWRHRGQHTVIAYPLSFAPGSAAAEPGHTPRWVDASTSASGEVSASLEVASRVAVRDGNSDIQPIHIMVGVLRQSAVATIIARLGVSAVTLAAEVEALALRDSVVVHSGARRVSPEAMVVLLRAYWLAHRGHHKCVEAADLLEAVAEGDERVERILFDLGITLAKLRNAAAWLQVNTELVRQYRRLSGAARLKPKGIMNRALTAVATPTLDQFSHDLTQLARAGFLTLAVAREKELNEMLRILESNRAVLLVGNDGVGKTAMVQALASAMAAETVPLRLQDKRLVNLSVPALIAGAGRSGEVEQRIMTAFTEMQRAGNVILAVEGLHNLVSVSSGDEQSINLSEVFAEGLEQSGVLLVATATPQERAQLIERSPLAGLLDTVVLAEPDDDACLQMLAAHVGLIEARERVAFTYGALERCVELSRRYIRELALPAQAIRLMEEAGVYVRRTRRASPVVTAEDVSAVVSEKTGVPVTAVSEDEEAKLQRLEEEIHRRIVGQHEAVQLVSQALRRSRTNLRDPKRPIASFLFMGPTGVGKTELAKTIAEVYFGNEQTMVRLDMSEYQLASSLPQLLGTPDGTQVGVLTEAVRRRPFTLLLLDELEKAHPNILNIFLQVMEDGRLTDSLGRTVDFTNVIMIATSNAAAGFIQEQVRAGTDLAKIRTSLLEDHLKGIFRPEFLNRFDAVVVFSPLNLSEVNEIAKRLIAGISKRLEERGVFLRVTDEAVAEFAQAGFDPQYGARPLRRVLQETVENTLANFLLTHQVDRRDVVVINAGGQVTIEAAVREI